MKYIITLNPTIHEWENNDPIITKQLTRAYSKLLVDNKLNPYHYKPVLGWCYENDDFVKNRITLVIEAQLISTTINDENYIDAIA